MEGGSNLMQQPLSSGDVINPQLRHVGLGRD